MVFFMKQWLLILAFSPAILFSQSRKERKAIEARQKADQVVINSLKSHIQNLTGNSQSDNAGFEAKATEYLSNQFKAIGLQPKGSDGYIQSYNIDDGKKIDASTFLRVNDKLLEVNKEFFPLSYSAEKKVKGTPAMALRERGVPWFVDLKDWLEDGSKMQSGNIEDVIKKEIARVATKGATALFLYNSGTTTDGLSFNGKDKNPASPIPVIYVTADGVKKYFTDRSETLDIDLNVAFKNNFLKGSNVIGGIDNGAASAIIIGAHYDQGQAEPNTKIDGVARANTAGADDNASGLATLIELARMLSASKAKNNNYVFIAFGGPDKGATGVSYWLNNTANIATINYMVNLDMVGSYNDSKKLLMQGYNTSPIWKELITSVADKQIQLNADNSGVNNELADGFYKKGIPDLSFSSSGHADYSTSADEEGKINYAGTLQILKFVSQLIETADSRGKIAYTRISQTTPVTKVAEQPVTRLEKADNVATFTAKSTVSLGVIPDRTPTEQGLKISGVTPKKLASKIGLQPGDVLTTLGTYHISDFKSYMYALSKFKAGDKTTLRIKRGKDDREFTVEF
jgi:hypothetical protein